MSAFSLMPAATVVTIALAAIACGAITPAGASMPNRSGQGQGGSGARAAAPSEKESRTPAQQKINSQLLYELYRARGEARQKQVPPDPTGVKIDLKGRAYVDVRAEVTPALQKKIQSMGGTIQSTSREYRSIIAWIPLRRLERLAEDPAVRAIEPVAEAAIK